ncbi:Endo-beta-N-acetylglucosaminidase F1 [termite gut metagenome]|uniref:Endo-beta-N-acetylglucosaminidase F1 n=1 Tax=termite gut metagenome TaxID=433724 RepID=A0A5J4SU49_9ZZZZ
MQNYIKRERFGIFIPFLTIFGMLFTACDDKITIGEIDETPYQLANETYGYLRSSNTSRNTISVEIRDNTDEKVYFGLTKVVDAPVSAQIGIDESLVEAYNKANLTSYEVFPASQVTFENGGKFSVAKWRTASEPLTISLSKGNLEEKTYLLPITVKEGTNVKVLSDTQLLYYLVKVSGTIPDATKGSVKTLVYIEVNNTNPLNAGNYLLENSRKPFFDMVVIFAANVQYSSEKGVYLKYNENVEHLLKNRDKYIKPLQDKGIKVILGLLNDHAGMGIANLKGEVLESFAAQCKVAVDAYGLDGVDLDDEWADYPTASRFPQWYPEWTSSGTKMARFTIELRRLMPDKIITVFEYGMGSSIPRTVDDITMVDIIDYSMYAMYSTSTGLSSTAIGMPKEKFSPKAINLGGSSSVMSSTNLRTVATNVKNGGYGFIFFYDLGASDMTALLSNASSSLYEESLVLEGPTYAKDW